MLGQSPYHSKCVVDMAQHWSKCIVSVPNHLSLRLGVHPLVFVVVVVRHMRTRHEDDAHDNHRERAGWGWGEILQDAWLVRNIIARALPLYLPATKIGA